MRMSLLEAAVGACCCQTSLLGAQWKMKKLLFSKTRNNCDVNIDNTVFFRPKQNTHTLIDRCLCTVLCLPTTPENIQSPLRKEQKGRKVL